MDDVPCSGCRWEEGECVVCFDVIKKSRKPRCGVVFGDRLQCSKPDGHLGPHYACTGPVRPGELEHEGFKWFTTEGVSPATGKPSETQVGGDHYKKMAIQPSEFIYKNKLGWCEGNALKYICRHEEKGGRESIEKAIHYLQLLLQWKYGGE